MRLRLALMLLAITLCWEANTRLSTLCVVLGLILLAELPSEERRAVVRH